MLVRSCKHSIFRRNKLIRLYRADAHYDIAFRVHFTVMARDTRRYKDWSHESLVERVELLEKQLREQNER